MAEPILTVEHLDQGHTAKTPVLDDVSFAVKPGEVIVVVGPSGCGKSTLLRCLNGLEPTQSGRVRLGSETVAYGGNEPDPACASASAWCSRATSCSRT